MGILIPSTLKSLTNIAGKQPQHGVAAVLGCIVGLSVPLAALLLAAVLRNLLAAQMKIDAHQIPGPSRYLPDIQSWLPEGLTPLGQFTCLLLCTAGFLAFTSVLLFLLYRQIQIAAVHFESVLLRKLREQARGLATTRTISAQQTELTDCLDYHLPRVRAALARWWRAFPRHVIQLTACAVLMLLVQPMLCVLTIVATALVVLVFRLFDFRRRSSLPVVRERAAQQRADLTHLCTQGPLLESVHDAVDVQRRFDDQLAHYERDAVRSLTSSAWKMPIVILAASLITSVFLFVIIVQLLRSDASFTVPGAFAFTLCFIGAIVSSIRLQRSLRDLNSVSSAAETLNRFLSIKVEPIDGSNLVEIKRIEQQIELDHITLQDSSARRLLEDVSMVLKPGILIGVVARQRLQARAFSELLIGFGRPVSGRLLFDGKPISDISAESVTQISHWVASDGALVTGTVQENILAGHRSGAGSVSEAIEATRLVEQIQQLPDALSTLITPDDDRLRDDAAFRIGLARARVASASIIVIEEPSCHFDQEVEQQSLTAIRSLVSHQAITVCLPQRLLTLRSCDVVIMLDDHKIVDTGTHTELLQRNEYYRHLNYLRFNPFQASN